MGWIKSEAHLNDREGGERHDIEAEHRLRLVLIVGVNAWQQGHHELCQDLASQDLRMQKIQSCLSQLQVTHDIREQSHADQTVNT